MSTDRLTEILNYVTAISREVGEFRQEFHHFRDETNARLDKIEGRLDKVEQRLDKAEREQRQMSQLLRRVGGTLLTFRADIDEITGSRDGVGEEAGVEISNFRLSTRVFKARSSKEKF
jgi:hypothetical protein